MNEFQEMTVNSLRSNARLQVAAVKQVCMQTLTARKIFMQPKKDKVLIYQMGKVGSTNLIYHLLRANIDAYQVHRMDPAYSRELLRQYRSNSNAPYRFSTIVGRQFRKKLLDTDTGAAIKVLCPLREPVGRNISHFFQDIERFIDRSDPPSDISQLRQTFVDRFEHDYPQEWFDKEFAKSLKFNIFQNEFPKELGFKVYELTSRISLFVFKIELASGSKFKNAFKDYLGIEYPDEPEKNVGSQKKYGQLYKMFKDDLKLPNDLLDRVYTSQFATHFYSDEELSDAKERYRRSCQGEPC